MNFISIKTKQEKGPKYWRSLNELANSPKFRQWAENEFPENPETMDGSSRRTMLKLMAASFGLAGLTACSRPVEHIFPNSKGTENIDYVPGAPYFYSTIFPLSGEVYGLLVETYDGRPTKIEGNPDHPYSLGAATALAQGSLLNLYDPDRSKQVVQGNKASSWQAFEAYAKTLPLGDGSGLRFLSETVSSPALKALRADTLKRFPKAKWVEYESFQRTGERKATDVAFGQSMIAHPHFEKAKVVLALDSDFLGADSQTPLPTKRYASRRRFATAADLDNMSRLYAVESQFSMTGANADHRLRLRGSDIRQFAIDLAVALGALPGLNVLNNGAGRRAKFVAAVAKDLKAAGPEALVIAGPRQPATVQALAYLMNQTLGSLGNTIAFSKADSEDRVEYGVDALKTLTGEMSSGQVSTLAILGGNPVYTAPADLRFAVALSKVANSIHLGPDDDETAAAAKWHLPEAHFLESWGDGATTDGIASVQQPMIEPLFGGRTVSEVLAVLIGNKDRTAHDIVKNYWTSQWPAASREETWKKSLNDGILPGKPVEMAKVSADAKKIAAALAAEPMVQTGGIEIGFVPSPQAWDGRFANNGWMQEMPHPMSRLTWSNAAMISPATAKEKNLTDGDIITFSRGGYKLDAAIMLQPGQADDSITIALGYGRERCGSVGKDMGFNANLIRTTDGFWYSNGFDAVDTGNDFELATTQERGLADHENDRPLVREATVEEYKQNPKVIGEMEETLPSDLHSVYTEWDYSTGYQWGMSIDLAACTGCHACVVACQAENNIPIVGKRDVIIGREMHWIRIDRYYVGSDDEPRAVDQPLPCMQCENAPCENVCPVAATNHSPEGLNDMVYNRCVGTRYCLNNCPYKVRHFNYLNFHRNDPEIRSMVFNPDVTVRMRGVMEKCTYCVQRIQETKIRAQADNRRAIRDGEIKTACQQTCPADAIVFGDINDPQSRVSKLKKQPRNYALLGELDTRPRTTHLGRLRNPNPELGA